MIAKIFLFCSFAVLPRAAFGQEITMMDLEKYKWHNRLVMLFAPSATDQQYETQIKLLNNEEAGLVDRDIKVFHLFDSGQSFVDEHIIVNPHVDRLARKYEVDPREFTVLLIDKDGTEKLRQNEPIAMTRLFAVIHARPMRNDR